MKRYYIKSLFLLFSFVFLSISNAADNLASLPVGFIDVDQIIPNIKIELRYYTAHNFIGERIEGYLKPKCILTKEAANTLKKVQTELELFGLGLKIFDAYRPQRAVDHFVQWAKDLTDIEMKAEFYPNVKKENLFKEDYIADRSSHSRGSTVDLTIISLQTNEELDMGSGYDFFSPESWPNFEGINLTQRSNRMLLQTLMIKHGFKPYPKEWWHFTLKNEPFPNTYFNFPIQ
jgi:D-alanyl-D-alanine dipeptidase